MRIAAMLLLLPACGLNFSPEDGETMKCYAVLSCDGMEEHPFEKSCGIYADLKMIAADYRVRITAEASTRCANVVIESLNCETDSPWGPNGVGRSCSLADDYGSSWNPPQ